MTFCEYGVPAWRRCFCAVDAILPPVVVLTAFRAGSAFGAAHLHGDGTSRPGLLVVVFTMFIAARGVSRLEQALRFPSGYRSDLGRVFRAYLVCLAVAISVRLLV